VAVLLRTTLATRLRRRVVARAPGSSRP
jgi:hypothetical protein